MGLRAKFKRSDIRVFLEREKQKAHDVIITFLAYLGEECINQAKEFGSYTDRTGNLRSSIGYMVLDHGQVVRSLFKGDQVGQNEGEKYARSLVSDHLDGFVLLVVAGMKYAVHVESRGFDVLDSAQNLAEKRLPSVLRQIKKAFRDYRKTR